MRIAFTHNLQTRNSEDQAEFDRPETILALSQAIERLGHTVYPLDVSGPVAALVEQLEGLAPDLVFNTAEGKRGRFREAFYPGLFEQLGIPFTGSDAYGCLVSLDKQLSKAVVAARGVPTPAWKFVESQHDLSQLDVSAFRFPVILKPNFEGSSKGITQSSVIETPQLLGFALADALNRYPDGILVEEYIDGEDITVGWLEAVGGEPAGVLEPTQYVIRPDVVAGRKYAIYDFDLKNTHSDAVDVRSPADVSAAMREELRRHTAVACRALSMRDLARCDWRITADGRIYFIEINALPSLEPGAGIYAAAACVGLDTIESVLDAVIRSAAARAGISTAIKAPKRRRAGAVRVGFTYNVKRQAPSALEDSEAEFDSPATIEAIRSSIESLGYEVMPLEATTELAGLLQRDPPDVVFNIAEGFRGRARESQVPALLEFFGIPYTGSDPATLAITLDKPLAKQIVAQAGVSTPAFCVMRTGKEKLPDGFQFPAIAKPAAEGSSKGVFAHSVVTSDAELRELVREIRGKYDSGVLVEEYLSGREFTVGLLGGVRPRVLPPMEILFAESAGVHPVYTFEHKQAVTDQVRCQAPADVDSKLARALSKAARASFMALRCRDVARIDFRLDSRGNVNFIECNPLPGLSPGWSDLCVIAESAGMSYQALIGEILAPALRRYKESAT